MNTHYLFNAFFTNKNTRMIFCDFDIIGLATLKKPDPI